MVNPIAIVDHTALADHSSVLYRLSPADPPPSLWPPIIASPPVRSPLVRPPPGRPSPVADTLAGSFGGVLQGLDDHNPAEK